jgi:tetratricopeptide (TPR) repeat protein
LGAPRNVGRIKQELTGVENLAGVLSDLKALAKQRLVGAGEHDADPTIVIAIDQAEEMFNIEAQGESIPLLDLLAGTLSSERDKLLVIATIRSDRYEQFQSNSVLLSLPRDLFDLPSVPPAEFKSVIEGPMRRVTDSGGRLAIEPALTERLIEDAQGADALPLLAFTLERLYVDYGREGYLTLAAYEMLGGVQGSIEAAVAQAFAEPGRAPAIPAERELQLDALRAAFIPWLARINPDTHSPMRRVARREEIPESSRSLVDRLVSARLLIADRRGGFDVIEVAHESLLRQWPILTAWLQADADALVLIEGIERAAGEWIRNNRLEAWLDHRAERLSAADVLMDREDFRKRLGAHGLAYLSACKAREETERKQRNVAMERERARLAEVAAADRKAKEAAEAAKKRLKQMLGVAAVGGLIALVAAGFAVVNAQTARLSAEEAQHQRDLAFAAADGLVKSVTAHFGSVTGLASWKSIEVLKDAEKLFDQISPNTASERVILSRVQALQEFARAYNNMHEPIAARARLDEAKRYLERLKSKGIYEALLTEIDADIERSKDNFTQAIEGYQHALSIVASNEDGPTAVVKVRLLRKVAEAATWRGPFEKADTALQEGKTLLARIPETIADRNLEAVLLDDCFGDLARRRSDFNNAETHYRTAISGFEALARVNGQHQPSDLRYGQTLQKLGDMQRLAGKVTDAAQSYRASLLNMRQVLEIDPGQMTGQLSVNVLSDGVRKLRRLAVNPEIVRLTSVPLLAVEDEFKSGVGPFRFGMTRRQANALFPVPFRVEDLDGLPIAVEYRSGYVQYIWRWFRDSPELSFFHHNIPCVYDRGYITLLFKEDSLFVISLRSMPGGQCPERDRLLENFASKYNIPVIVTPSEQHFRFEGSKLSVVGRTSSDTVHIEFSAR